MDQREFHLQPMGICYRFYHFITKTLASQALKTVNLGHSTCCSSTSTPAAPRGSDSKTNKDDDDDKELPPRENKAALPKASLAQTKSLRKVVSISDNVEEILASSKKKKRSKSFQKSSSMDEEEEKEEEPKPLRSILKVGSILKDRSNSIC